MKYLQRERDVITGNRDLETIYTFKNFPVYMGTVENPPDDDGFADMTWMISKSSGLIQLNPVLPLEVVYKQSHGSGAIGALWTEHHKAFAQFMHSFCPNEVLEIGGGHGHLYLEYQKLHQNHWSIVEPNPNPDLSSEIKIIERFFDKDFEFPDQIDAVVHSHVLEHIYEPNDFFECLSLKLDYGQKVLFSVPNMEEMLKRKYLNCLNFEHTILLTGDYIEFLLAKHGFDLLSKQLFHDDHSVFYAAVRTDRHLTQILDNDLYLKNRSLVNEYIKHFRDRAALMNCEINSSPHPTYIFGAHVFTQFLIAFGLDESMLKGILDNDPNKQNKRLSGTILKVDSPEILRGLDNCNVVLTAGAYNHEIKNQINSYEFTKVNFICE
jgi:hypothetical protein